MFIYHVCSSNNNNLLVGVQTGFDSEDGKPGKPCVLSLSYHISSYILSYIIFVHILYIIYVLMCNKKNLLVGVDGL